MKKIKLLFALLTIFSASIATYVANQKNILSSDELLNVKEVEALTNSEEGYWYWDPVSQQWFWIEDWRL